MSRVRREQKSQSPDKKSFARYKPGRLPCATDWIHLTNNRKKPYTAPHTETIVKNGETATKPSHRRQNEAKQDPKGSKSIWQRVAAETTKAIQTLVAWGGGGSTGMLKNWGKQTRIGGATEYRETPGLLRDGVGSDVKINLGRKRQQAGKKKKRSNGTKNRGEKKRPWRRTKPMVRNMSAKPGGQGFWGHCFHGLRRKKKQNSVY